MEEDFYLDERWLASYFEKDWFDLVLKSQVYPKFDFPKFDPSYLYSDYHEKFIDFLNHEILRMKLEPTGLLEVGSSLGRTFYEVCKKISSIKAATLVEPSNRLTTAFKQLFLAKDGGVFPLIKGNRDLDYIKFDNQLIKETCSKVDLSLLELPFQKIPRDLPRFELVISSNVLDQCQDPRELIERLKNATKPGGVLALSCTYQWQEKYLGGQQNLISDINEFFSDGWELLNETDIPFKCRRAERYWMSFLSHASVYRRLS